LIFTSFAVFLVAFAVIGGLAAFKAKGDNADYLVASRSISPWLAGLSAMATNNSGYMFIGMIGYTYHQGLSTIWLMLGWIVGDFVASLLAIRPIIIAAEKTESRSLGALLANWVGTGERQNTLGKLSAVITILFLSAYSAAQFKSAGITLEAMFQWDEIYGIFLGAGLVLIYCFSGGIRASIWTDAAQSFVMLFGMILLAILGYLQVNETEVMTTLPEHYFDIFPNLGPMGIVLFILGWMFGGAAMLGQPQIISRYFSLRSEKEINHMRIWYYTWYFVFYALTVAVGLLCRLLIPPSEGFNAEQALPLLSKILLPDIGIGLILAAIFAATMSTADSLILACTASVTEEAKWDKDSGIAKTKWVTLSVMTLSIIMALIDSQSIFSLVLLAWGFLASAFAPLIVLRSMGRHFRQTPAIITLAVGISAFLIWKYTGMGGMIYEVAPGLAAGMIVGWFLSKPIASPTSTGKVI
jgi:sodium/proline symporter